MKGEKWYYMPFQSLSGRENMAIDARLLNAPKELPLLRGYTFLTPTVTLGRFQKVSAQYEEGLKAHNIECVRRISGGRAVLHQNDFTYSLTIPKEHPIGKLPSIKQSYMKISEYFQKFLSTLGVEVELYLRLVGEQESVSCFASTSYYELGCRGKKLLGSAQSRNQKGLMQHGTLYLSYPIESIHVSRGNAFPMIPLEELEIHLSAEEFYAQFLQFLSESGIELIEYHFSSGEFNKEL